MVGSSAIRSRGDSDSAMAIIITSLALAARQFDAESLPMLRLQPYLRQQQAGSAIAAPSPDRAVGAKSAQ